MLSWFRKRFGKVAQWRVDAVENGTYSSQLARPVAESGFSAVSAEEDEGTESWAWEARFAITKRAIPARRREGLTWTRQNGRMSKSLNPEELDVLGVMNDVYPRKMHLHELAQRLKLEPTSAPLRVVVDGLFTRGFIEGKALRGSEGLADAANLLITKEGIAAVERSASRNAEKVSKVPLKFAQASVLNVLIASPSDVSEERDAVESAIREWNAGHFEQTGIMLNPVRWETHSYPASGGRPQGFLNTQIVESAHFLIPVFGSRIGSPTGRAPSGTLEEIEQFLATGRHVALYFSNAPVARDADREQLDALEAYQQKRRADSLYATFGSVDELRRRITQHLPKIVAALDRAMREDTTPNLGKVNEGKTERLSPRKGSASVRPMSIEAIGDMRPKEIELLWNAAKDPDGDILHSDTFDGEGLRSNGKHFLEGADRPVAAEWLTALSSLEERGVIVPLSDERTFFQVTGEGYAVADELEDFASWEATSITLRAHYMNAESQELAVACSRVVAIPATYYADQVGADRSVMRSVKERRSLLVEGIASKPAIDWNPNDVEFVDVASGEKREFRVDGMTFARAGILKMEITG